MGTQQKPPNQDANQHSQSDQTKPGSSSEGQDCSRGSQASQGRSGRSRRVIWHPRRAPDPSTVRRVARNTVGPDTDRSARIDDRNAGGSQILGKPGTAK